MATIKLKPTGNHGFNMFDDLDIATLGDYDHLSTTSSLAKFYDNADNYTSFSGTGFKYQFSGGYLIDVRAGKISHMTVVEHGVTVMSVSGLNVSASKVYDYYVADDRQGALDYLVGGNDTINGTTRADQLYGGKGKDRISAGGGNDTVYGDVGNDVLKGGNGRDFLSGSDGNDVLNGGAGNDRIFGGDGSDVLSGGSGADIFYFDGFLSKDFGRDTIRDFSHGQHDKIGLSAIDADIYESGNQAFHFIHAHAFTETAGEARYHKGAHATYVQLDRDGDGDADIIIGLRGAHTLVASDFIL